MWLKAMQGFLRPLVFQNCDYWTRPELCGSFILDICFDCSI